MEECVFVLVDNDYKLLSREVYTYEEAKDMGLKLQQFTCNGVRIMRLVEEV